MTFPNSFVLLSYANRILFFFFFNPEIEVCTLLNSCKKSLCKVQRIVIHVLGLSYKTSRESSRGHLWGCLSVPVSPLLLETLFLPAVPVVSLEDAIFV